MKKQFNYLIVVLLFSSISHHLAAQCTEPQALAYLEGNDIRAAFRNAGDLFWDGSQAQYHVNGSGGQASTSSIFAGALWLTAFDAGGNLKTACQTYRSSGTDFWAGPLDDATQQAIDCNGYDQIWKVAGSDVRSLLIDFNDNGVVDNPVANSILAWPGKGNVNSFSLNGITLPNQDLAPFFDRGNDGIYNPYDGDYPIADPLYPAIIADDLLWMVFNDNGNLHGQTLGAALMVEVQLTAYAFSCDSDPVINKTIFTRYKVINKNPLALLDFKAGLWTDFDLGCGADDYIGSIPSMNTVYVYNMDAVDDASCGLGGVGYGNNPPVQALTLLNQTMSNCTYNLNSASPTGDPSSSIGYANIMNGSWTDGTPVTVGGSGYNPSDPLAVVTPYVFPDNPNDSNGWSMFTEVFGPVDVRAVVSMEQASLPSTTAFEFTAAYSYHRDLDSSNLQNVNLMYQQIPMVQNFYDNGYDNGACSFVLPIHAINKPNVADLVRVYPNPTQAMLTIDAGEQMLESIELFTILGESVYSETTINSSSIQLNLSKFPAGNYFLRTQSGNRFLSQMIQVVK